MPLGKLLKGQFFETSFGAVDETRTRDLNLGKVALYQLSYYRIGNRKPHGEILLERVMGIEPTYPAWKAGALPLSYTRA